MSSRPSIPKLSAALAVAFAAFALFGLTDGVFGTIWPTQRADLGRTVGDLSWLVSGYTIGSLVATTASGHISGRWGTSRAMLIAAATIMVGLVGLGTAPNFWALAGATAVYGAGVGLLDASTNAWATVRHGARVMGFLHAFFGIGGAMGPLIAAWALDRGSSWRSIFIAIAGAQLIVLLLIWLRRFDYDAPAERSTVSAAGDGHAAAGRLLRLTLIWFFVIVGVEASVASWSYSLLVEERSVADAPAAVWVAVFWGTFTVARILMGLVGDRLPLVPTLRASVALTVAGSAVLSLAPDSLPAGIALPVLGLGISLLFPVMVLLTPEWLGAGRTGRAVGYQLSASSIGTISFAVVIGRLADRFDLEVLGPVVLIASAALAYLLFVMERTVGSAGVSSRSAPDTIDANDSVRDGIGGE